MTSMRIGARKRHEIQRVNETASLRMAALLPEAGDPPDTEPSVYAAPTDSGASPPRGAPSPGVPPPGCPAPDRAAFDEAVPLPGPAASPWAGHALTLDRRAAVGLLVLLLLTVGYGVQHFWLARPQRVEVPAIAVASVPSAATPGPGPPEAAAAGAAGGATASDTGGAAPGAVVVVDIGGRVGSPGVHILPGGSRVADALRVAGGPLPGTDTRNLNLARVLADGEQILVGEPSPQPATGAGPGPPSAGASKQPVSLNHATLEQLDTLPGVGPTLAQRILTFRASHGGTFRSLDQLRQVSGIGERTYTEIRPLLTL
ncbi:helix-hairpin-helix domain-containing protein [Kitasatospora sp. NPDC057965]|uniref:helix-hairpin-helix domain-containing protein n=1 Tax=Kitasatospora sp. NPDC057965 TaxID=3346291 RepID=UPI0036DEBDA2